MTTQQWSIPQNFPNYKSSHDICCRSRNRSPLHQLSRGRPSTTYTGIHGTPPTTDPDANGQHNSAWHGQQQRHEKAKSNGHEIPLALRQRKPRPIQTLLGTRKRKQWRLHHQTPCPDKSSGDMTNISNWHRNTTSTTKETHRDTSCSKGVLDILRCI